MTKTLLLAKIKNLKTAFDKETNKGYKHLITDRAMELILDYCDEHPVKKFPVARCLDLKTEMAKKAHWKYLGIFEFGINQL